MEFFVFPDFCSLFGIVFFEKVVELKMFRLLRWSAVSSLGMVTGINTLCTFHASSSSPSSPRASWTMDLPRDQSIGEAFRIYELETLRKASKLVTMENSKNFVRSMLRVGKEAEFKMDDDVDPLPFYRAMVDHYEIEEDALEGQRRLGLDQQELLSVDNTERAEFLEAVGVMMYLKVLVPIFEHIGTFNNLYSSVQGLEALSEPQMDDLRVQISFIIASIERGRKPIKGFWKKLLFQSKTDKLHDLFQKQPLSDIIESHKYKNQEIVSAMLDHFN